MSLDLILLHLTLEEGEADVSLRCRDGTVAGHRLVLAALSPMLCRAFRELGGDEEKVCIQLPDFTTEQVNLPTKFHMSTKFLGDPSPCCALVLGHLLMVGSRVSE